jgi:hypothetical protein
MDFRQIFTKIYVFLRIFTFFEAVLARMIESRFLSRKDAKGAKTKREKQKNMYFPQRCKRRKERQKPQRTTLRNTEGKFCI